MKKRRLEDPGAAHGVPDHRPFPGGLPASQFNSPSGQQTWFSLLVLVVMLEDCMDTSASWQSPFSCQDLGAEGLLVWGWRAEHELRPPDALGDGASPCSPFSASPSVLRGLSALPSSLAPGALLLLSPGS